MKKKQRKMFRLFEIRRALQKWKSVWMKDRDIDVDWHNFKYDLRDSARKHRK